MPPLVAAERQRNGIHKKFMLPSEFRLAGDARTLEAETKAAASSYLRWVPFRCAGRMAGLR